MKRISARKLRIGLFCKLKLNNGRYIQSKFQKRSALINFIGTAPWQKAYLKVLYHKDFHNDGWYNNTSELKFALAAFTEKPLLDYFDNGKI